MKSYRLLNQEEHSKFLVTESKKRTAFEDVESEYKQYRVYNLKDLNYILKELKNKKILKEGNKYFTVTEYYDIKMDMSWQYNKKRI